MPRVTLMILIAAAVVRGGIIDSIEDEFREKARRHRDDARVADRRALLETLRKDLSRLEEHEIRTMFGRPVKKPRKTYALPVAHPRMVALPGVRYADEARNKDRIDFHALGDYAGLDVYYGIDGRSVVTVVFRLKTDERFTPLTADNLDERLAWEEPRWQRLRRHLRERLTVALPWEVDTDVEDGLFTGMYGTEVARKHELWFAEGRKRGYRYEKYGEWDRWYRADGTLARFATLYASRGKFIWYHADGKTPARREDGSIRGGMSSWRWFRTDGTPIRVEHAYHGRPNRWEWYDADGRVVRIEWDENRDRVPDFFRTTKSGAGRRLPIDESWAVHPKLIPEMCRIPDQPGRRLPLRAREH